MRVTLRMECVCGKKMKEEEIDRRVDRKEIERRNGVVSVVLIL